MLVTLIAASIVLGAISLFFTELFRIGLGSPIILLGVMMIAVGGGLIFIPDQQQTVVVSKRTPTCTSAESSLSLRSLLVCQTT